MFVENVVNGSTMRRPVVKYMQPNDTIEAGVIKQRHGQDGGNQKELKRASVFVKNVVNGGTMLRLVLVGSWLKGREHYGMSSWIAGYKRMPAHSTRPLT